MKALTEHDTKLDEGDLSPLTEHDTNEGHLSPLTLTEHDTNKGHLFPQQSMIQMKVIYFH